MITNYRLINGGTRPNLACGTNTGLPCNQRAWKNNTVRTNADISINVRRIWIDDGHASIHMLLKNTVTQQFFGSSELYTIIDTNGFIKRPSHRSYFTALCTCDTYEISEVELSGGIAR